MERQRVVHYARSRTAKVIPPRFGNYPASSPATTSSETSQAPLASIDSDFVIVTKRRDETNMAPNLWSHANTDTPQTNFILQNRGEHSAIFDTDENYGEQNDFSPPRTYLKLRASQNVGINNVCEKLNASSRQYPPHVHIAKNNHKILNIPSNSSTQLPTQVYNTRSTSFKKATSRTEITYHRNSSYVKQLISQVDNHTSTGYSNHINSHTRDNNRVAAESEAIKEDVFMDGKIKPSVPCQDFPEANVISDHSSLNRQTCALSSSPDLGRSLAQNSSRIDCGDGNFIDIDVTLKGSSTGLISTDRIRKKDSLCSGFSEGVQDKTANSQVSKTVNRSSAGRVDKMLAVDCLRGGEEMQPEVSGISPSEYTSDIRLASERIAQIYTQRVPHSRYSHHYCSIYVTRNPNSSLNESTVKAPQDRVNFHSSLQRDVQRVNAINQNSIDIKYRNSLPTIHSGYVKHIKTCPTIHPDNIKHTKTLPTTDSSIINYTRTCPTVYPSNVNHTRTSPRSHSVNGYHPESTPCWKRSSLRHTTYGYNSISELTLSMENLHTGTSDMQTSVKTPDLDKSDKSHSGSSMHSTSTYHKQTREFGGEALCGRYSNSPLAETSCSIVSDITKNQPFSDDLDLCGSKRKSYQLATSDGSYERLNKNSSSGFINSGNSKRAHLSKSKSLCTDTSSRWVERGHLTDASSRNGSGRDENTEVLDQGPKQHPVLDTYGHEERLRALKRRSYKLATSSLSDLTFLDDSIESGFSVDRHIVRTVGDLESRDYSGESINSSLFPKPDGRHNRARDDSFSSGRLNSSFGSFYSCQSRDLQMSVDTIGKHPQIKHGMNQERSSTALDRSSYRETVGSESSFSGDSSAYYTASDNSYPTTDGVSATTPYADLRQPPTRMTMLAQRQKPSANRYQQMTQSKSSLNSISLKANALPQNIKSSKYYSQSGVFRCYGCGVNDKFSIQAQPRARGRKHSARLESSRGRVWVNPDYLQGKQLDQHKRSRSAPASRYATRQAEASARKLIPAKAQMYIESGPRVRDLTCSISAPSPGSSSASSFIDSTWDAMPRIPPSLGRPRRKLYAGFDSQPLPMDSFLSDSSSVYSTHSYSSWGTSRSATVESCSRTPDLLSKARSTSSIASSLITPTRPTTHADVFDFFTYTDKRSSVSENKHNLYLSRENSCPDDCYNEVFYDMTYSKESLESFLSDGTTVNADHDISPENNLSYEKTRLNSFSGSADLRNNKRADLEDQKQNRQNNQLDFVRNRSCNGMKSSASLENRKNQLKTVTGSAPDNSGKSKFLSKRKYFSTKDIFDLVISSDRNYKNIKGRSRSLERQAQKVCETILCLT